MFAKKKTNRTSFKPHLVLALFVIVIGLTSVHAQKYSDWSAPVNIGPAVNSAFSDQQPAISKNGLSLYFTSNRPVGLGGFDLQVSQRASVDDPWGSPVNLGSIVNSTANEGNPAFSRDEHLMFFQSDRPGGLGAIDIWVSRREHTHDDFAWQPPVNLGAGVNSIAGDNAPSYFENDEAGVAQLYLASNRAGGLGGLDMYVSEQAADGSFGPAVLITELSSSSIDTDPSIRSDGREMFFHSNRTGSVDLSNDLWVATRESALDAWSTPVNLGVSINTASSEQNAYLSSDRLTLVFASDRPGGFGGTDLYISTRTRLRGPSGN